MYGTDPMAGTILFKIAPPRQRELDDDKRMIRVAATLLTVPPVGGVADHMLTTSRGMHAPAVPLEIPDARRIQGIKFVSIRESAISKIFDHL